MKHFQGYSTSLLLFCLCLRCSRKRERGIVHERILPSPRRRMPSSPNTFSTAIFPYFFLPVAMFVFAIANIKTARARPIPPFLVPFPEEGNAPISYSGAPSRDIIPHRCRDSYENRGESHIFRTKWRNAYRFEIARGLTFLRRLLLLYFALWEIVELQGLPDTTS